MSSVAQEIASQPEVWRRAAAVAARRPGCCRPPGSMWPSSAAARRCSWREAWAAARELAGQGPTDAFTPSEALPRRYDAVVLLTRSGTTTEVLDYARSMTGQTRLVALTGTPGSPVVALCHDTVLFALRRRAVRRYRPASRQAPWPCCARTWARPSSRWPRRPSRSLTEPLPVDVTAMRQFVFLGQGMAVGVAREAALKLREAAGAWTEAYPATEFRHGPISAIGASQPVWALSPAPAGLREAVAPPAPPSCRRDAIPWSSSSWRSAPAVRSPKARGLDPDHPLHLTRSVILRRPREEDRP